jgi:hypothetical protein
LEGRLLARTSVRHYRLRCSKFVLIRGLQYFHPTARDRNSNHSSAWRAHGFCLLLCICGNNLCV